MIGLATRGYLRRLAPDIFVGDGPQIASVKEVLPSVSGSSQTVDAAPTIVGASVPSPILTGATETPTLSSPGAPSISGGSVLVPIIRKAEEN